MKYADARSSHRSPRSISVREDPRNRLTAKELVPWGAGCPVGAPCLVRQGLAEGRLAWRGTECLPVRLRSGRPDHASGPFSMRFRHTNTICKPVISVVL